MNFNQTNIGHSLWWKKLLFGELLFWGILTTTYLIIDYSVDNSNGEMLIFRKPLFLLLLTSILPLHWFYLKKIKRISTQSIGNKASMYRSNSTSRKLLGHIFFTRVIIFLVLALAQPSIGKEKVVGTTKSLELVVCLDVSNSMNVKDMEGSESRMTASKRALNDLINHLSGEKIGLCVFAGASFVQLPLTSDYEAAKLFIEDINTDLISQQGTNISSAISTATTMFSPTETGKAVLLITDGEDHDGNALESVRSLKENYIELHVLGIGSKEGGPLQVDALRPELGYRKDKKGQLLISKVDPKLIVELANAANGSYLLSSSAYPSVDQLLTEINQIQRTNLRDLTFEARSNNYQLPLGAALLCFVVLITLNHKGNKPFTE
jgi:Ca-activated chloride channel family protein